jgi:gliding motility-associated-like protein
VCPDSATIEVTVLPLGDLSCDCPLNGSVATVDVTCFGDCSGEVTVSDSLGFAIDYSLDGLSWQTDSTFINLCAGNSVVYSRNTFYGPTCIDTLSYVILTPPPFIITQLDSINETCYNDCDGEITITSPGALLYSIDNGATFQNTNAFSNLCVGNYNIVTVDSAGCMANGIINITGPPKVIAAFSVNPQPTFVPFTEITFTNQSQGAINYTWSVGGLDTFSSSNLIYEFAQEANEYQVCLYISNSNGCTDEVCNLVIIKEELNVFIPNAFTPDFNNTNEIFKPVLKLDMVDEYSFEIYDRWGEKIFKTNDPTEGWDGTVQGKSTLVQTGVYIYKVKVRDTNNKYHNYIGSVNLIK